MKKTVFATLILLVFVSISHAQQVEEQFYSYRSTPPSCFSGSCQVPTPQGFYFIPFQAPPTQRFYVVPPPMFFHVPQYKIKMKIRGKRGC